MGDNKTLVGGRMAGKSQYVVETQKKKMPKANIFNFINWLRILEEDDFERLITFMKESRSYPYFSSLYDSDMHLEDLLHFADNLFFEEVKCKCVE